ncbi:serine hydrolase [Lactococcus sp. dk322]|nr:MULTISPECIES: serine hydrolase [unclassified Lactococcus]MQW22674.1 serine hydrolase [Lactococcus sp. dk101]TXK44682.1 serine hydrolase [Lactococcus sp. dk310]TXK50576.1 serine hydrolase [Lactococcus sp. dk322]
MQKLSNKVNIGVGLAMILMIIPSFFTLWYQDSSKENQNQTKNETVVKAADIKVDYWETIPRRAISVEQMNKYADVSLTKKLGVVAAKTRLSIVGLKDNSFKLSDGTYVSAKKAQVSSDIVQKTEDKSVEIYTKSTTPVYYNPYTSYNTESFTSVAASELFTSIQVAQTLWGTYYEVSLPNGQKGWISQANVSETNPKMQQVQTLLNQKYNDSKYSIYVKQIDTKFTAGVNQNEKMYSASLAKIPILYWTQKQINSGYASLSDGLRYDSKINSFYGSYQPQGTGNLPKTADDKVYSLQDVINRTVKLSDNVGSNLLAYYETNQFSQAYQNAISKLAGEAWNPKTREASAQMVGNVLEGLYEEGGASFDALFNTAFDNVKIKAGVPSTVSVAHKIGSAGSENHDAAVVFASTPYILVIETTGGSDQQIQQISQDIYEVLK